MTVSPVPEGTTELARTCFLSVWHICQGVKSEPLSIIWLGSNNNTYIPNTGFVSGLELVDSSWFRWIIHIYIYIYTYYIYICMSYIYDRMFQRLRQGRSYRGIPAGDIHHKWEINASDNLSTKPAAAAKMPCPLSLDGKLSGSVFVVGPGPPGARAGQGYIAVEHYLFLRQIFQLLPAGAEMILEPTHINPWTCATSPIGKQIGHCTYLA